MRTPVIAAVLLLCISGTAAQPAAPANTRDAPPRPNILFAIADDQSYPHASAYGCTWIDTPGFDRVAAEGVLFTYAYTPNPKCAPSRSVILAGRNPWQLGTAMNHQSWLPPEVETFPPALADAGYFVGYTGKGWGPGRALDADGNRRNPIGRRFDEARLDPPAAGITRNDYAGNFDAFLAARADEADGSPFFFWYGCYEPHRGYEFRSGSRIGGRSIDEIDVVPPYWPDVPAVREDLLDYGFEIEHFDAHLVRMLSALEAAGELANTVVIVTADNGMPFPRVKGQIYETDAHLPLAVMWPDGLTAPGRVFDGFVTFADFGPTILELAGVPGVNEHIQPATGVSFADVLRDADAVSARDHVLLGKERHDVGRPGDVGYPVRGIRTDRYLYTRNYEPMRWPAGNPEAGYLNTDASPTKTVVLDGRTHPATHRFWVLCFGVRPAEELYDLSVDPFCVSNLAGLPGYAGVQARLAERLQAELVEQGDPRALGRGDEFDLLPTAATVDANHHARYLAGEAGPAGWVAASDYEDGPLTPSGAARD